MVTDFFVIYFVLTDGGNVYLSSGSIISISNLMQWLLGAGRIDQSAVDQVNAFIVANQCPVLTPNLSTPDVKKTKVGYIFTDRFHTYLEVGLLLC